MNKKPTVKDVAREAGVSVATVSYILNDRKDQKISPDTKKKVLQIANLLNYRPSHAAKVLATGKANLIGISYTLNPETPSRNMEYMLFVNQLTERLNRMNYDVIYISADSDFSTSAMSGMIDGIIAIDLPDASFRHLADNYLVPVIGVDMHISDPLFYQIYTDYATRIAEAREILGEGATVVIDPFSNENFQRAITDLVPDTLLLATRQLDESTLLSLADKKVIVINNYLALLLRPYVKACNLLVITSEDNVTYLPSGAHSIHIDTTKKANLVINILMNAIGRKFDVAHEYPM